MDIQNRFEERTGFQESAPYSPKIDLRTDFIMVYGIDETMPDRVKKWREKGYIIHLMTGISWGEYQEYLYGRVDGTNHWDEAQKDRNEDIISHGKDVPYMVPTLSFTRYLIENLKIAVDNGAEAIHLEEPEFWVEGGYSDAFKREWEIYYKENWEKPHSSVNAQYKASKLKSYLYERSIRLISAELKEYAKVKYNKNLSFYVPTHSLINYTQWRIVSPQSKLLNIPTVDGYIAQVWTGTARTKNVYNNERKERTFETAFLEYGIMQELIRNTDRKMWFLHDPIEDNPIYSWADYQKNYFQTLVASLFHPDVHHYEVTPWPHRIFNENYLSEDGKSKESIPESYGTTLLVLMNTLRNFDQDDVEWSEGLDPIGIFLSDSAMYQRSNKSKYFKYDGTDSDISLEDEEIDLLNWSSFYGLALPPLKEGIPVRPVQLDNVSRYPSYLSEYEILVLSYEFMKPQSADVHQALSQWVNDGGKLVYIGDDSDEYHMINEWWNRTQLKYETSTEHLFDTLGLGKNPGQGEYSIGKGKVIIRTYSPDKLIKDNLYLENYVSTITKLIGDSGLEKKDILNDKNYLLLRRGPYIIIQVLEETTNEKGLDINGQFVNLFDANLPIIEKVSVNPGEQLLLYDLEYTDFQNKVEIIASSSRLEKIVWNGNNANLFLKGPLDIQGVTRLYCKEKPTKVCEVSKENTENTIPFKWDAETHTVLLKYAHSDKGLTFKFIFKN